MRTRIALFVSSLAAAASGQTLSFSNQTVAAGIDAKYQAPAIVNKEYLGPCACGDFNADGWEDLIIPSGGGTNGPDRFYVNQANGSFAEQGAAWGLSGVHPGLGLAVGDANADGFLDIYECVAAIGQNKLYRNSGSGSFSNVAAASGLGGLASDSYGACFGDYDLDGDLDLLVAGFHDARLFRQNAGSTFSNVTTSALGTGLSNSSVFSTHFVDMDGDRYPELLVSGDFGSSRYFHNSGNGTFTNQTATSGTGQDENAMGGTVADFDRNGKLDWYVSSIYSTITPNWTGNKLYLNSGSNQFAEWAHLLGVDKGSYGWGTVAVDFNHDRWLDIAETNGNPMVAEYDNVRSFLWLSDADGSLHFNEVSAAVGFDDFDQGRGLLNFDYDNDGDQDLLVAGNDEPAKLWRNDLTGPNIHWLRVKLDTGADHTLAPNGWGSIVRITANGVQQTSLVGSGDNLESQSELAAHFGLRAETVVDTLRVEWPDGRVTELHGVLADQTITVSIHPAWTNLDSGLAGVAGVPGLAGTGLLNPGSAGTLVLSGAAPSAACLLFIALASTPSPFKGGVLVPLPALLTMPFVTLPDGTLPLPFVWPTGLPSGLSLWFQEAISDVAAVKKVSLSNALKAQTP